MRRRRWYLSGLSIAIGARSFLACTSLLPGDDIVSDDAGPDAKAMADANAPADAATDGADATSPSPADANAPADANTPPDASAPTDANAAPDTNMPLDANTPPDASASTDATVPDAADDDAAVVLTTGLTGPMSVAIDSTNVYWTTIGTYPSWVDGAVFAMPLGGGPITTIATGQSGPEGIAVRDGSVYWTTTIDGTVMSAPIDGGPATTLATGQTGAYSIAVDDANVYWADFSSPYGKVMRVPLDGGSPLAITQDMTRPHGIAVYGDHVYWTDDSLDAVFTAPIAGGPMSLLATNTAAQGEAAGAIAVDATGVYWLSNAAILKAPLAGLPDGGAPITLATEWSIGAESQACLVLDADNVYWTDGMASVLSVPKGGGTILQIATNQNKTAGLALSSSWLYWANGGLDNDTPGAGSLVGVRLP